jgi:hypothetical protein
MEKSIVARIEAALAPVVSGACSNPDAAERTRCRATLERLGAVVAEAGLQVGEILGADPGRAFFEVVDAIHSGVRLAAGPAVAPGEAAELATLMGRAAAIRRNELAARAEARNPRPAAARADFF